MEPECHFYRLRLAVPDAPGIGQQGAQLKVLGDGIQFVGQLDALDALQFQGAHGLWRLPPADGVCCLPHGIGLDKVGGEPVCEHPSVLHAVPQAGHPTVGPGSGQCLQHVQVDRVVALSLVLHHFCRGFEVFGDARSQLFEGQAQLAEGGSGMGVLLVHARRHQPSGEVHGHRLVQGQLDVHQVVVAIDEQPALVVFVDGKAGRQVGKVPVYSRAVDPGPPGDLGLGQPLGIGQQERLDLQQTFRLARRSFHIAIPSEYRWFLLTLYHIWAAIAQHSPEKSGDWPYLIRFHGHNPPLGLWLSISPASSIAGRARVTDDRGTPSF